MSATPFFVNRFGDRYLYDVNRNAFNQAGAANVFRRRYGEALFAEDKLTIIVGTDSGLLLKFVQDRGVPSGSRFLFLELDSLLPGIIDEVGSELADGIQLTGQRDLAELLRDVRFTDYANLGGVRLIESIGVTDDFHGDYRDFFTTVRQQLDAVQWIHNTQLSNPSFVHRQLENLIEQHVPARVLKGSFEGQTALLIGGGPSLDELLPFIRQHQDDMVLFAVSRVCRRLRDAGITPHIVASIDPTELSFDISKELLEMDPDVVLAHANHMNFPLLAQWRGRSVFLDRRYPWPCKDEPDNIGSAGPTVTNTAFVLAQAMGFSTIVLAGIDLCHSPTGYSHARGSNEFDAGPKFHNANMRVPTNRGGSAETSPDFYNAIKAFGGQAGQAVARGIRVINPAADAAAIANVEHVAAEQLSAPPPRQPIFATLHGRIDSDPAADRMANFAAMKKELARVRNQLRQIVKLSEEALECNDGLFGRRGKPADFRHKHRMDKIERQIDRRHGEIASIVKMFSARAFLHMPPSDRDWTDEEIEQAGITYYTAYRDNANTIIDLIEHAQQRIEVAVEESRAQPDFERLFARWDHDRIPGRALVWLHRHDKQVEDLPDTVQPRFDAAIAAFREILDTRDTGHARKMQSEAALGPLRSRLLRLFKERDHNNLDATTAQLARQESAEGRQLHGLALGYLAELDEDSESAFAHYATLIELAGEQLRDSESETSNPRLEDALRRMIVIALDLQQIDQAQLILQTLAEMSPAYLPQYADLLRLTGQYESAVDVYNHYLRLAPDDHLTMLRLGKLYQEIGALDAARTAFTYILEKDPDNKAARSLLQEIDNAA